MMKSIFKNEKLNAMRFRINTSIMWNRDKFHTQKFLNEFYTQRLSWDEISAAHGSIISFKKYFLENCLKAWYDLNKILKLLF